LKTLENPFHMEQPRQKTSNLKKIRILEAYHNGENYVNVAQQLGVKRKTADTIVYRNKLNGNSLEKLKEDTSDSRALETRNIQCEKADDEIIRPIACGFPEGSFDKSYSQLVQRVKDLAPKVMGNKYTTKLHETTDPDAYLSLLGDTDKNETPEVHQTYTRNREESLHEKLLSLREYLKDMNNNKGNLSFPRIPLQPPPPVVNRIARTAPGKQSNTVNKTRKPKKVAVVKNKPPVYANVFDSEKRYNQLMETHKRTHLRWARKLKYQKRKAKKEMKKASKQRALTR
jgi:hypothetical protein